MPYPFGPATPVEGRSDAHALRVDKDACVLYELYAADWNGGRPTAGSGAVWDLRSHALRPSGWTSADAAGLPILPRLLRRDEVVAGEVDHAVRLTARRTDRSFVWPARHQAGAARDPALPPMGAWFRLKAAFDISGFRPDTQVGLRAMQRHGLILADNGFDWYFTGTSEPGWDTALLAQLKTIPAGALGSRHVVADGGSELRAAGVRERDAHSDVSYCPGAGGDDAVGVAGHGLLHDDIDGLAGGSRWPPSGRRSSARAASVPALVAGSAVATAVGVVLWRRFGPGDMG